MRMLPNGEVVAIPAAERWAAEDDAYRQAAADAGTPTGEGQGRLHQHFDTIKVRPWAELLGRLVGLLTGLGCWLVAPRCSDTCWKLCLPPCRRRRT